MEIKHAPIFDVAKVVDLYSARDGAPVRYVCTTDIDASDQPYDVFYRDKPHPKFNNRYFGLTKDTVSGTVYIRNADLVEKFIFGMIQDRQGNFWYSQTHHNCLFIDESMIDGGRQYIRSSGPVVFFKIKDGKFNREQT